MFTDNKFRIKIIGDRSYIVRWYSGELVMAAITEEMYSAAITEAYGRAKASIQRIRDEAREMRCDSRTCLGRRLYTVGGVHRESGTIVAAYKQARKALIEEEKVPQSRVKHVGVEIEFLTPNDEDDVQDAFIKAGLSEFVNLTTDGSVQDDGDSECDGSCRDGCECYFCENNGCEDADCSGDHEYECNCECDCGSSLEGLELRVLAPQRKIKSVIKRVCKVLSELDAQVNSTCGLHVHLDMRARSVDTAYNNLIKAQDLLYSMVPGSRRSNRYCRPSSVDAQFDPSEGDRYVGINPVSYKKHKTLEVRIHSGSTNADKINNWIGLLVRIADAEYIKRMPSTLVKVATLLSLSKVLVSYITERLDRFSNLGRFKPKQKQLNQAA